MGSDTGFTGRLLYIIAAVVAVGTLGWVFASGATAGGMMLCLLPAGVVTAGLIAGGMYLSRQGAAQQVEMKTFEQQETWRGEERRARTYVAERLEQAAARLATGQAAPAAFLTDLRSLADRLRRPGYDQGVPPPLDAGTIQSLQSLDASLMGEADKLDRAVDAWLGGQQASLRDEVGQMRRLVDRRTEALVQGGVQLKTAREVLASEVGGASPQASPADLKLGDAVSVGGQDFTVSGRLAFNDRGLQFSRYQLRASGAERWLLPLNGGVDTYWLSPITAPEGVMGVEQVVHEATYTLRGHGTAEVDLEGMGGERRGLLIDYRRFVGDDDSLLWAERWPDGQVFAFRGERVGKYELQIFQQ